VSYASAGQADTDDHVEKRPLPDAAAQRGAARRHAGHNAGQHDPTLPPPPPPPAKPPPLKALPPEPDPVVATQLFAEVAK